MPKNDEYNLQRACSKYLAMQYPNVIFNVDLSGVRLPIGLAKKVKGMRSSKAFPDMVIYKPSKGYHGLFIEFKTKSPYRKNGQLKSDEHLQEQEDMIRELNNLGYKALFVWSFEQFVNVVKEYLL